MAAGGGAGVGERATRLYAGRPGPGERKAGNSPPVPDAAHTDLAIRAAGGAGALDAEIAANWGTLRDRAARGEADGRTGPATGRGRGRRVGWAGRWGRVEPGTELAQARSTAARPRPAVLDEQAGTRSAPAGTRGGPA